MKKSLFVFTLIILTTTCIFAEDLTDSEIHILTTIDTFITSLPASKEEAENILLSNGFISYIEKYFDSHYIINYFGDIEVRASYSPGVKVFNLSPDVSFGFCPDNQHSFIKTIQKCINYYKAKNVHTYFDESTADNTPADTQYAYYFIFDNSIQVKIYYYNLTYFGIVISLIKS